MASIPSVTGVPVCSPACVLLFVYLLICGLCATIRVPGIMCMTHALPISAQVCVVTQQRGSLV